MAWKVVIDIAPSIIPGTNGCHEYVHDVYKTKKEAARIADSINDIGIMGTARVEKA